MKDNHYESKIYHYCNARSTPMVSPEMLEITIQEMLK
jgi:hypothetical protein